MHRVQSFIETLTYGVTANDNYMGKVTLRPWELGDVKRSRVDNVYFR